MGVTLKELLEHLGLQESQLNQRCNDDHLREIALHMDKWQVYASYLGLTKADIDGIEQDGHSNHEKKLRALQEWKKKNAFKATFRFLVVDVFLKAENAELAEKVCSLLVEKGNTEFTDNATNGSGQRDEKQTHVANNPAREPPTIAAKTESGKNIDLQCKDQSTCSWKPADTKLTLQNISNAIKTVVEWNKLGQELGLEPYKLRTIEIDYAAYGQSRMKDEMINSWLAYDVAASWKKLCLALENIGERVVAQQIRDTLHRMVS